MYKTVVVLGQARSGTSMTAAFLQLMGINMNGVSNAGFQNPKGSFEDMRFITITAQKKFNLLDEHIKTRNKENVWGFKSALTHTCLDQIVPKLRNPVFVVVFRNPLTNAQSWVVHCKHNYSWTKSIFEAFSAIGSGINSLMRALNNYKHIPMVFTTYEGLKTQPLIEGKKIADFLGIPFNEAIKKKLNDFIIKDYSTLNK